MDLLNNQIPAKSLGKILPQNKLVSQIVFVYFYDWVRWFWLKRGKGKAMIKSKKAQFGYLTDGQVVLF
jgi:hypothetical protein